MFRACDTIQRFRILDGIHPEGCSHVDLRLIGLLLTGTYMMVHVSFAQLGWFENTLGSTKGNILAHVYLCATLLWFWLWSGRKQLGPCSHFDRDIDLDIYITFN